MEGDLIKINHWLRPLSWLYGAAVRLRNLLFDEGVLEERTFSVPTIAIGNITVGGTGKTPHVEYLVRLLHDKFKVAVLSRGYKRKSKGYVLASESTPMNEIGDEPCQMKHKFPDVNVAVCVDRCEGIERLTQDKQTADTEVVILDDAFQHRYVKPGINILLTDYHRLFIYDELLPAGRLREPKTGKNRADIVIVTKCPQNLKAINFRVLTKAIDLFPYQELYFTTFEYDTPVPLFEGEAAPINFKGIRQCHALLVTGIGSPRQMEMDLEPKCKTVESLSFADHHQFTTHDAETINRRFESLSPGKVVLTTEKDAVRLRQTEGLSKKVRQHMYVLPIKVRFLLDGEEKFNQKILSYVRKDSADGGLAEGADDYSAQNSNNSGHRPGTISFRNN